MHISMAFLNKGDCGLLPNPGYPTYRSVTQLLEAEPIEYDLKAENNWQPDFDALEAMNTTKAADVDKLPAHAYWGRCAKETFERLIRWARERDILLINDNP